MAHRSGVRPRGPAAPPTPKTVHLLMDPRRNQETVHVGELRIILAPFVQDLIRLQEQHEALGLALDLEEAQRQEQAARIEQYHRDYIASTWEARVVARWVRFRVGLRRKLRWSAA